MALLRECPQESQDTKSRYSLPDISVKRKTKIMENSQSGTKPKENHPFHPMKISNIETNIQHEKEYGMTSN